MQDIVLTDEDVWKGGFFRVRRQRIRSGSGKNFFRELVSASDGVAIVPITNSGQVLMIQEYVAGSSKPILFFPGGMTEAESESRRQQDAQRELREELGLRANKLIKLWQTLESPTVLDCRTHVYVGFNLVADPTNTMDDQEDGRIQTMNIDDAIVMASSPDKSSASVLGALFLAKQYIERHPQVA